MLAAAVPPPAMVEKAANRELVDLLKMAAVGLEDNAVGLPAYIREAWPVIEPDTPFVADWYVDCIAEHVQAALDGQIRRLIINGPPRSGKSLPVSVFAPSWDWTRHPGRKFGTISYSQDLATKANVDRRTLIDSDYYRARWGDQVSFTDDQNLKKEYVNTARGHMVARGTGAGITGYGFDVLLLDDPLNPELAESEAERRALRDYYDRTLYSRLNDKKQGVVILVEQRLHAKDLTQHLLTKWEHEGWTHLVLPAEAPERKIITFPVTGRQVTREAGDVLSPSREPAEVLAKTRAGVGQRRYNAQWQQRPSEEEGNLFLRRNWRLYRDPPNLRSFEELIQSWDMTFKDTDGTDYVVGQVWGVRGAERWLLDQMRGRMSFSATLAAFRTLTEKWPGARRKLVEEKANGNAVCDVLKKDIEGIILIEPNGGKLARAYAAQPCQEAGNLWIPDPEVQPWSQDFIDECAAFPDGDNDDQVDAMTQLVNYRINGRPSAGLSGGSTLSIPRRPDWA